MSRHRRFRFENRQALLDRIAGLGLDIPLSDDLSPLFEPIVIAGKKVPNRIVVQPMEGCDAIAGGAPGELTFRRYERFARGGSGMIWFEAAAVVPEGRSNPRQLLLTENTVDSFARLVDATRRAARSCPGGGREPLLLLQLTHAGRFCRPDGVPRPLIARHDPILDALQRIPEDLPPISDGELDRLQDAYIEAAHLAASAGFDGVDFKACHGYLLSELLASHRREGSDYGGSFEGRTRFLLDVVRHLDGAVPGLIVTSRINAFDGIPWPNGFGAAAKPGNGKEQRGGFEPDLTEATRLAGELDRLGCPLLNVSIGIPGHNPHFGRPFNNPLAGASLPDEHPLVGVERLLGTTARLQQALPDLPIVGTGYSWLREYFPFAGAAAIRSGRAAFVGIGRGAFAYPDCVIDLEQKKSLDRSRVCVGCSACSQIMRDGGSTGCVVHDADIYGPIFRQGRRKEV